MALTTYRTWVTGELVTAAMMNQQIRDNGNASWVGTTAGDMDYYTGATNKARIPIGTAGQVLQVNSDATAPIWGNNGGLSCYGYFTGGYVGSGASTTWTDIPLATTNVIVPTTSVLFAIAVGVGIMTSIGNGLIRWLLDGTAGQREANIGSTNIPITDNFAVMGIKTGVTEGTKVCKLQYQVSSGDTITISSMLGIILGFAE